MQNQLQFWSFSTIYSDWLQLLRTFEGTNHSLIASAVVPVVWILLNFGWFGLVVESTQI